MKTSAVLWQRAGAFALDYTIIFVYLLAVTLLFSLLDTLFHVSKLFAERVQAQAFAFLLVTLPVVLYFAAGESSRRQGTWGKRRCELRVTDIGGKRVSFWRALARSFLKFLPWEISHTLIWQIRFNPQSDSSLVNYGFCAGLSPYWGQYSCPTGNPNTSNTV